MSRWIGWLVAVVFLAGGISAVSAGEADSWVRLRYRTLASEGVPAASYTIIEKLDSTRNQRARVLFAVASPGAASRAGRGTTKTAAPVKTGGLLWVDLRVKGSPGGRRSESRWSQFHTLAGPQSLALALVAGQVELHVDGKMVASWERGTPIPGDVAPALRALRSTLSPRLLEPLEAFVRVGLARESAFSEEAEVLAGALFPSALSLPFDGSKRRQVIAVAGFDPSRHPPLPEEAAFGGLYQIPGRPSPASLLRSERGETGLQREQFAQPAEPLPRGEPKKRRSR